MPTPDGRNPSKFTEDVRVKFLELVAVEGPTVALHAHACGVSYGCVMDTKGLEPDFAERFEEAKQRYIGTLEKEIYRRGVEGVEEPIYYQGVQVGAVRRFSDRLLELHVKRHEPAYREKQQMDLNLGGGVLVVSGQADSAKDWQEKFGPAEQEPDKPTSPKVSRG